MSVSVGGEGGTGSKASAVSVSNTGKIQTEGLAAVGLFAQSTEALVVMLVQRTSGGFVVKKKNSFTIAHGGDGGTSATGGDITATNKGASSSISTVESRTRYLCLKPGRQRWYRRQCVQPRLQYERRTERR